MARDDDPFGASPTNNRRRGRSAEALSERMSQSGGCSALRVGGSAITSSSCVEIGDTRLRPRGARLRPQRAMTLPGDCATDLLKQPGLAGYQIEEPDCGERPENADIAGDHNG